MMEKVNWPLSRRLNDSQRYYLSVFRLRPCPRMDVTGIDSKKVNNIARGTLLKQFIYVLLEKPCLFHKQCRTDSTFHTNNPSLKALIGRAG